MSDGFGSITPASLPLLERVLREETLGKDQGRQSRNKKPVKTQAQDDATSEDAGAENSMSSTHINLRI
jgi:hypothetical protein